MLEGPRVNLVAKKFSGKEPISILMHIDTVPIGSGWSVDPFSGIIKDGRIYGRGVSDMKGAIAALISAFKIAEELSLKPRYDFICCLVTDEEIGFYPGSYHLALNGFLKGHILSLDGSQDPRLMTSYCGVIRFFLTVYGKSAHGGLSYRGANAIEGMAPLLKRLLDLKDNLLKRESSYELLPLFRNEAPSSKLFPLLNMYSIYASNILGIIPDYCTLVFDRHYTVEENIEDVIQEVESIVKDTTLNKKFNVKLEHAVMALPYKIDVKSTYARRMKELLMLFQGYDESEFQIGAACGYSDLGFVANTLKTDKIVITGARSYKYKSNDHQADENVRLCDLSALIKELICYLYET